ncbi:MAG: S8 family peptidase [Lachnospiraceae bacterium]|nr:S8 family peptidase [Lachnospiraceae bacterium]
MERAGKVIESASVHQLGFSGAGVGIAFMDTGIFPKHPDIQNERIIAFQDFVNGRAACYDDCGHGTHIAGIAGGTGVASNGRFVGVAPACFFIGIKILDNNGNGNEENVFRAVDWIIKNRMRYHIRIVNISIGTGKNDNVGENSPLVSCINELWEHGIIVCVAAGNNGPGPGSVGAPGNSRKIITVGSCDYESVFSTFGRIKKDYSGRGPTSECIKKPDLVAPGSMIVSCGIPKNYGRNAKWYAIKSGTSMSTPMVSGAIALLLQKYPEMTNREVKIRLKNRSVDLGLPHEKQGWGRLNLRQLLSIEDCHSDCE